MKSCPTRLSLSRTAHVVLFCCLSFDIFSVFVVTREDLNHIVLSKNYEDEGSCQHYKIHLIRLEDIL